MEFSSSFARIYDYATSRLAVPVQIFPMEPRGYNGTSTLLPDRLVVELRIDLPPALIELVAAHELLHPVLWAEGHFRLGPRLPFTPLWESQFDAMRGLMNQLAATVDDCHIDERLAEEFGMSPAPMHVKQWEDTLARVTSPQYCPTCQNGVVNLRTLLFIVQLLARSGPGSAPPLDTLRASLMEHMPRELELASPLAETVRQIGWRTPDHTRMAISVLRHAIDMENDILFYDPYTLECIEQ
jgi:hypothetical protein